MTSILPEHDTRFKAKHIIITGAGGNFGREGCIFFSLRGAKVTALDLNKDALIETEAIVKSKSNAAQIACFVCNVTDAPSVQLAIDESEKKFGTPDMLWSE
eukprot:scaffold787_cov285-Chaetoceros_neogracile.AAC.41